MHSENINTIILNWINMKTIVPDRLAPGLTDKQLECLNILRDGNWHDHREISRELKSYIPSNISGRMVRPLEKRGIVEQEERTEKEGSKRKKKFVRIRREFDEHLLHLLIEYSANDLVNKFNNNLFDLCFTESNKGELPRVRPKDELEINQPKIAQLKKCCEIFLDIRNKSLKKCRELEQQAEKYWEKRKSFIKYSKSWPLLVEIERKLADAFEEQLKLSGVIISESERVRINAKAASLARDLNPDLWRMVLDESHQYEDAHLSDEERMDLLNRAAQLESDTKKEHEAAKGWQSTIQNLMK
jgi:hypothetical protein